MNEIWYTLDDIETSNNDDTLYCITVDSPDKQFLVGKIGAPTHNSEQGKAEDEMKGEAAMIIGSIARLGRAAGVHLIIATQRPDAKIIAGETKANLGVRVNCGRTDSNASSMILGTSDGVRVRSNPRGRLYLRIFGEGDHGQGFFASPSWLDEYLASKGLNQDGTPLTGKKSRLAKVADMSQFEGADLDTREGVDNSSIIEKIREEEEGDSFGELLEDNETEDSDWGFSVDAEDTSPQDSPDEKWVRPTMGGGGDSLEKWKWPEEDWDEDLESLISENFDKASEEE